MKPRSLIPIRLKILVSLLFVVTAVVSVITFTMANMFHRDKTTYINDLVSIASLNTAAESRSLLVSYVDRLKVFSRIVDNESLVGEEKASLLKGLFEDFPELIAIAVHDHERELLSAINTAALQPAGLSKDDIDASWEQLRIPRETLTRGAAWVRNTSPSAELPALTLAVVQTSGDTSDTVFLTALVSLEGLLELSRKSSAFEIFLLDAGGVLLAHPDAGRAAGRAAVELPAGVDRLQDRRSAGVTLEFVRDDIETIGGYASVDFGGITAAAEIPKSAAFLASRHLLNRLLIVAFGLLAVAALFGLVWAHRITRPVERLSAATRAIAKGRFDIQVQVTSRDEIGALAGSFNQMASELDQREQALQQAQTALIHSEKMAAFGQLGAGIAHEVKNPLAGILGCAQLSLRKVDPDTRLYKNIQLIEKETKRCKLIIENLMKFARQEKAALEPTDVNSVIEDAAAIVRHQLELSQVALEVQRSEEPLQVHGNANQLEQVLINLMINAHQALAGEPGTVRVAAAALDGSQVEIRVSDSGPGMSPEVQEKLFEPFFTTKPGGKGTGLGLSVSYGIVQEHQGEITVDSSPGNGATFKIVIPRLADSGIRYDPAEVDAAEADERETVESHVT